MPYFSKTYIHKYYIVDNSPRSQCTLVLEFHIVRICKRIFQYLNISVSDSHPHRILMQRFRLLLGIQDLLVTSMDLAPETSINKQKLLEIP
jgi:hypothetical protein